MATLASLFNSDPLLKAMLAGDENGYLQNLENEWKAEKVPIHRLCALDEELHFVISERINAVPHTLTEREIARQKRGECPIMPHYPFSLLDNPRKPRS